MQYKQKIQPHADRSPEQGEGSRVHGGPRRRAWGREVLYDPRAQAFAWLEDDGCNRRLGMHREEDFYRPRDVL